MRLDERRGNCPCGWSCVETRPHLPRLFQPHPETECHIHPSPLWSSREASKGLSTTRKHFDLRTRRSAIGVIWYHVMLLWCYIMMLYDVIWCYMCYHSEHSANPWHAREVISSHQLKYRIVMRVRIYYKLSLMDTPKSGSNAHPLVAVLIEYLECGWCRSCILGMLGLTEKIQPADLHACTHDQSSGRTQGAGCPHLPTAW